MRKKELKKRVAELEAENAELQERLRYSMPVQQSLGSAVIVSPPVVTWPQNTWLGFDYFEHCGCNPKNGGSGVCGCVRPDRNVNTCMV